MGPLPQSPSPSPRAPPLLQPQVLISWPLSQRSEVRDFGLSNTLKAEALSLELLTTQCGSPAYAAPELLAHRKYGPKVDVWSVGVSMFAMLTGTLPFTVEPFNIKQLLHKMVTGDISSFPRDVSQGTALLFIGTSVHT
ncbi:Hormonally up-regulated neu tumor-associated kinase B [Liparis tanakae]|uniref:non-specific serine/threonine protein kinase n=1 Tax=Liparis tanakae TaxID=230148 RepID=A0A4Z2HHT2_9TELE|nr:Hormonally up-regulated neu tumor-associated kinase B [Liparis tanakae]